LAKNVVQTLGVHAQAKNLENLGLTIIYRIKRGRKSYVEFYRQTVSRRAADSPWWAVGNTAQQSWEQHGLQMHQYLEPVQN
jgi:hypothetical protein